jgi:hypothetical protein
MPGEQSRFSVHLGRMDEEKEKARGIMIFSVRKREGVRVWGAIAGGPNATFIVLTSLGVEKSGRDLRIGG